MKYSIFKVFILKFFLMKHYAQTGKLNLKGYGGSAPIPFSVGVQYLTGTKPPWIENKAPSLCASDFIIFIDQKIFLNGIGFEPETS